VQRRTTIILGIVAAAAVTAATLASFSGGSSESKAHKEVAAYIDDANKIQSSMTLPFARVRAAFRQFADKPTGGADQARQLAAAEQTLWTLRRRLSALVAPAAAVKLRRLLIRLAGAEARIAHAVQGLATFMPVMSADLAASRYAATVLGNALAAVPYPKATSVRGSAKEIAKAKAAYASKADAAAAAQADALTVYEGRVTLVIERLRALRPPTVMRPTYQAQVRALVATRGAVTRLAAELRKRDRSRVPQLNRQIKEAARLAASIDTQRAQIAAIKLYNARVRSTESLQLKIRSEFLRVQAAVG
jgi:hypothetical protein